MRRREHTRRRLAPALAAAGLVVACASAPPTSLPLPTADERAAAAAAGYEAPPVRSAASLLPADLLSGPHYSVGPQVVTRDFTNYYTVTSDFGDFEVQGDDLLETRLREIAALAALDETSATAEFAGAAARAVKSPFVATWNLVTDPVDSILGIPTGAWNRLSAAAQLARGERGELEDSGLTALIGFEAEKRRIAAQLDVDPYSSNGELQKRLNQLAWAAYAGGLPFLFVPFTGEVPDAEPADRLSDILLHYSPEELARLNRIELTVMGIPEPLSDAFLRHPWYSPRHETVLVAALAGLDLTAGRAAFIEAALKAESEAQARAFGRAAELLQAYDRAVPLERIVAVDGVVMGYSASGTLVLPLAADYAAWDAQTAALVDALTLRPGLSLDVSRTELWISGSLSPLAREQIAALGVSVTERAIANAQREPTLASDPTR